MIDKQIFESLLAELATYYKRPVTPFVQGIWYEYLSDRLTTEQFTQCVSQYLLTAKSMPTPEQIVEILCEPDIPSPTVDTPSLIEWHVCVEAAPRPARKALIEGLSPQGYFALRLVGGLEKLGAASVDELLVIKRQFLNVWEVMRADVSSEPKLDERELKASQDIQFKPSKKGQSLLSAKMSLNGNGRQL